MDLAWREGPAGRWIADATPLAKVSFERTCRGPRQAGLTLIGDTVNWDLSKAPAEPRLSFLLRGWERMAAEEIVARAEREALRRPVDTDTLSRIQTELKEQLARNGWAFRSKRPLVEEFAHAASLTPGQHRFARALLGEARDVIAAVDRRLAEPAAQEDLAAARDPDHRADLLEACRYLTSLDGDRAHDANSMGWSAVASPAGHRLAGREELTALEGGHARGLVHAHRRQLPAELRGRLGF
ncbi:hypothetical protein [Methylobacterium planeticum]|uniref:Uncharacterized protein n=1 Tax=Methylobacterium planeticum TaxID=2615211 RepID=A0A6N6MPL1_9HYPH|nr:hypothetical protein [Methylobacterium planeticum]KAB1071158.1 hypothetical protein F6X51_19860 [Methylobacterium planeticum]